MVSSQGARALVVDCGSFSVKVGHSLLERPRAFPAGADAAPWHELVPKELGCQIADRPVILGVPLGTPRRAREELCELLFESYGAPAVFTASTAFLSVLGAGLSTALVLDVGEAGATAVPVEEGFTLPHCAAFGGAGGGLLSGAMATRMQEAGCDLPQGLGWADAGRLAKEQLGYVAPNLGEELRRLRSEPARESCTWPGGGSFKAGCADAVSCAELLFGSATASFGPDGGAVPEGTVSLPDLITSALRLQSDINLRGRLLGDILLVGGTSQLRGLPERLLQEVRLRSPWVAPGKKLEEVRVVALPDRDVLPWLGGASLAECEVLQQLAVTRADYFGGQASAHRTFM